MNCDVMACRIEVGAAAGDESAGEPEGPARGGQPQVPRQQDAGQMLVSTKQPVIYVQFHLVLWITILETKAVWRIRNILFGSGPTFYSCSTMARLFCREEVPVIWILIFPVLWIHIHWIWNLDPYPGCWAVGPIWIRIQGYTINFERKIKNNFREKKFL